jgi:hypothetical protein
VLWAGDTRVRLLANVEHYGGDVAVVAITAPGRDLLPDQTAIWGWNRSAAARWRRLHRAAAQRVRRDRGLQLTLVAWTWEYQRRGALHKHAVVGTQTAAELAGAHAYVAALDDLREAHGFGFVDRGRRKSGSHVRHLEIIPSQRAARYVAKYLSPLDKNTKKPTLSETVTRPDVPPLVAYVSRTMTAQTGMTMRYLRWRRKAYMLKLPPIHPVTGELLDSVMARGQADEMREWAAIRQNDL